MKSSIRDSNRGLAARRRARDGSRRHAARGGAPCVGSLPPDSTPSPSGRPSRTLGGTSPASPPASGWTAALRVISAASQSSVPSPLAPASWRSEEGVLSNENQPIFIFFQVVTAKNQPSSSHQTAVLGPRPPVRPCTLARGAAVRDIPRHTWHIGARSRRS